MSSHLLEILVGLFLVVSAGLLAGLLRSAKASSQAAEEQEDSTEGHLGKAPQQPEDVRSLMNAS